ncbi:MAG: four helix bundle protein [Planctomycetes bacterium]|nr:four helix bundle protein [Planctomycetota bacterium]
MGDRAQSFRDLKVYQLAFELQQEIFQLTKRFPKEELYALTGQIRRASRSIGANISEAWHKRRYVASFVSKLTDADAEQAETQHWLDTSLACGYVAPDRHAALLSKCRDVGKMLGGMLADPEPWCVRLPSYSRR